MSTTAGALPRAFIFRRLHSLTGFFIVLFLLEHLFTNSQAALLLGEDGAGFVRAVDFIHNLPYLPVIEVVLLGFPIAFHAVLGVRYALSGKTNVFFSDGSRPSLREYSKNRWYFLQRFTSWILLIGIIAHVAFMRFYEYPTQAKIGTITTYFVRLQLDEGLYTLTKRLGVELYDQEAIQENKDRIDSLESKMAYVIRREKELEENKNFRIPEKIHYDSEIASLLERKQLLQEDKQWLNALTARTITQGEVIAASDKFGNVTLLSVRDAFKSPIVAALYTIFVLAAVFHAFNGLWTFCLSWGVILSVRSQRDVYVICVALMALLAFLGLSSIWGTYWINLKY